VFFSGKEGILIIIDELDRKSISKTLEIIIKKHEIEKNAPDINYKSLPSFTSIGDK